MAAVSTASLAAGCGAVVSINWWFFLLCSVRTLSNLPGLFQGPGAVNSTFTIQALWAAHRRKVTGLLTSWYSSGDPCLDDIRHVVAVVNALHSSGQESTARPSDLT